MQGRNAFLMVYGSFLPHHFTAGRRARVARNLGLNLGLIWQLQACKVHNSKCRATAKNSCLHATAYDEVVQDKIVCDPES